MHRQIIRTKKKSIIVGLMSGTSADGIDAVVAEISGTGRSLAARVLRHVHKPFPTALRDRILRAALDGHVAEICDLNFLLGEHFARATLDAIKAARLKPGRVTAIGSHGQTLHHLPYAKTPSTFQIGEAAIIAERTGITTVADFRVADMAAGGQGAPLVPYTDWALLTHHSRPRIVQNIGGIGNLTFLPPKAAIGDVMAFDTGPGNMVIDGIVSGLTNGKRTFDEAGRWAASGKVSGKLLREMMKHPFLKRQPPKTTGREEFGRPFIEKALSAARRLRMTNEDIVATVTAFTAESIADAYRHFVFPKLKRDKLESLQIILGGGGAKNPTLRAMLKQGLGISEIYTHEDFGIDNSAKEALAFAILAHETLQGKPSNVPSATGARRPMVLGKIIPA
jgi:anhydro-N-acetylmuramic acid kinase